MLQGDGEKLMPSCLRPSYLSLMPKSKDQLPLRPDIPECSNVTMHLNHSCVYVFCVCSNSCLLYRSLLGLLDETLTLTLTLFIPVESPVQQLETPVS